MPWAEPTLDENTPSLLYAALETFELSGLSEERVAWFFKVFTEVH